MELAFWLNEWRDRNGGKPTQDAITKLMPYGRNAVRARLYGNQFAEPEFVWAVISASGVTPEQRREWSYLYEQLARVNRKQDAGAEDVALPAPPSWAGRGNEDAAVGAGDTTETPAVEDDHSQAELEEPTEDARPLSLDPAPATSRRITRQTKTILIVAALVIVTVAATAVLVLFSQSSGAGPTRVITVQNKVAIGASQLIEDKTPAYLSSEPRPYCANEQNNCEVRGTTMQSGAAVTADCVVTNDMIMVNYDLKDTAAFHNPDAVNSRLWYHGTHNGKFGYISEIYVVAHDRGGLGLPTCRA